MLDETPPQTTDVAITMAAILGSMLLLLVGLIAIQTRNDNNKTSRQARIFPCHNLEPSKLAYEQWVAFYTPIWIAAFGAIVVLQLYESFSAWSYMIVCVGLALPLLLQPLVYPSAGFASPDQHRPLLQRYSFKANLWLAIYSFIGNYYYTHYFYSVLQAKYTMPAHRLNNVPIALFFATHFYFSTYHLFSNILLRLVETSFAPSKRRNTLFVGVILVFAYATAFMETLTISSYPYYSFHNRNRAYSVGSAFYGIYFLVSFPAFYYFDCHIDEYDSDKKQQQRAVSRVTVWDTVVSSCGYGMIILTILDFVRLALKIPFVMDVVGKDDEGSSYSLAQGETAGTCSSSSSSSSSSL